MWMRAVSLELSPEFCEPIYSKGWYLVKKLIAVLLCLAFATVLSIGVVGCGDKKTEATKSKSSSTT